MQQSHHSSLVSLEESDTHHNLPGCNSMEHRAKITLSKRWTKLESLGRYLSLSSIATFVLGILLTVFGFTRTGLEDAHKLTLQILGPVFLCVTVLMWITGGVFSRLWNQELKRQQQALELRDRVQIHALAMDILNNPVISPAMLQDPRLRRQLLLKLRAQKAFDLRSLCSTEAPDSRRPSRAPSSCSRRQSSIQFDKYIHRGSESSWSRKSTSDTLSKPLQNGLDLPGIQISRFETLDLGSDGIASVCSRGSKRYIIIHSDAPSDFSRISCFSDYSLTGSRSSRSRSSRASSGVSSRLWDFSPRDSEWDADISLGSRESQFSVLKQDWSGGPSYGNDYDYNITADAAPRKSSVVTFDMGSPSIRRHSSPASANRRKDSGAECTCNTRKYKDATSLHPDASTCCRPIKSVLVNGTTRNHSEDYTASGQSRASLLSAMRKRSMEQSFRSITIEEDEPEVLEESSTLLNNENKEGVHSEMLGRGHPALRRNNTDDSEVERRVARIFKEIELSTTESVDEAKLYGFLSDFDATHVEMKEVQIQTLTEDEVKAMLNNDKSTTTEQAHNTLLRDSKLNESIAGCSSGADSTNNLITESSTNIKHSRWSNKRSAFAKFSSAFSNLSAAFTTGKKQILVPTDILIHGVSTENVSTV